MTDEWSGFADLLANLIAKYASEIDIDALPDPEECMDMYGETEINTADFEKTVIENNKVA